MNPFFNAVGGAVQNNGFLQMLSQFQQFRSTFTGDPRAEVEKLVREKSITQQQLNQFQQMANQFQQLMK